MGGGIPVEMGKHDSKEKSHKKKKKDRRKKEKKVGLCRWNVGAGSKSG